MGNALGCYVTKQGENCQRAPGKEAPPEAPWQNPDFARTSGRSCVQSNRQDGDMLSQLLDFGHDLLETLPAISSAVVERGKASFPFPAVDNTSSLLNVFDEPIEPICNPMMPRPRTTCQPQPACVLCTVMSNPDCPTDGVRGSQASYNVVAWKAGKAHAIQARDYRAYYEAARAN